MIKNSYYGLTIWDVLSFFITGVVIFFNFMLYDTSNMFDSILNILSIENQFVLGIYYILVMYIIGMLYEPISNLIYRFFRSIYRKSKLFKSHTFLQEEEDQLKLQCKTLLTKSRFKVNDKMSIFHIAKSYILTQSVPTEFIIYLSKFGFYRNMSILLVFNIPAILITNSLMSSIFTSLFSIFLLIIFHLVFYHRAQSFLYYAGNEIYRNFLWSYDKSR